MNGTAAYLARHNDDTSSSCSKNIYNRFRNIYCANISVPSTCVGTAGSLSLSLSLYDIAPNRLRLGIGPSHQAIIEGIYGLPQITPLVHLGENVKLLRFALWQEKVDHHGRFFNVMVTLPRIAPVRVNFDIMKEGILDTLPDRSVTHVYKL